jgi:hypothetical protein
MAAALESLPNIKQRTIFDNIVQLWPPFDPECPPSGLGAGDLDAASSDSESESSVGRAPQAMHHDISHVYGEVVVESFLAFLQSDVWLQADQVVPTRFVDLGSGAGACLAAAAACGRFALCCGVELEESWVHTCLTRFDQLCTACAPPPTPGPHSEPGPDTGTKPAPEPWSEHCLDTGTGSVCIITVRQGSMYDSSWVVHTCAAKQPALVFCNATALNIPQMQQLAQVCEKLPAGSIVLTTTAALPSRLFDSRRLPGRLPMSWGSDASVHLATRKKLGRWAARMLPRY